MNLNIIADDGNVHSHIIEKSLLQCESLKGNVGYIGARSKESNALNIFKAFFSNAKLILIDESNKVLLEHLQSLGIPEFNKASSHQKTIFDSQSYAFVYFTSGSTGFPVAALKSKANIESEVKVLSDLFEPYHIKKVVVTIPFIHLYGTLMGLMYPLMNGIDIVLKEHFLPQDLLSMINEGTLVVTTPLYIKALNKLAEEKNLSKALFVSSTAPLDSENIEIFNTKFKSDIIQIFGSTETGGIAYRKNTAIEWQAFENVDISTNDEGELKVSSPFVSGTLYENGFYATNGCIQTFDYIEQNARGFKLIGRSSQIIKLAGKRYSTIQMENILENVEGIRKALVYADLDTHSLRGEYLDITLESDIIFRSHEIKNILKKELSNLKFSIKLNVVSKIPINQIGKKLRIK